MHGKPEKKALVKALVKVLVPCRPASKRAKCFFNRSTSIFSRTSEPETGEAVVATRMME